MGGSCALADAEHDLADRRCVHAHGFAVEFHSVELFALFGGKLLYEVAVLRQVCYFFVDLLDGAGQGYGFAGVGCHWFGVKILKKAT